MRTKEELKKLVCDAIDKRTNDIYAFADSVYKEPELGFKEVKTSKKFTELLSSLGYSPRTGVAITGVVAEKKGNKSKAKVALLGELDAILVPGHKDADATTGACHACGHNIQLSAIAAIAYALHDTDVSCDLGGDIVLMGVPAEEYIELTYRQKLHDEGKLWFLSGKEEFIRLGEFDDIDAAIMQHITPYDEECKAGCTSNCNGFVTKIVKYKGKEAHAGAAPFDGINALNAACLGIMGINANRETFKEEDSIRVHPIITKGGDVVNVVPADVRMEMYVRGSNVNGILKASKKTDDALKAGAMAVGAQCEIIAPPGGYLPIVHNEDLIDLMYDNMKNIVKENVKKYCKGFGGGSTDFGDVSTIIPGIHSYFRGVEGGLHQENYKVVDRENALINAAKCMICLCIDLLYDDAKVCQDIKSKFKPIMTKEQYLKEWGGLK